MINIKIKTMTIRNMKIKMSKMRIISEIENHLLIIIYKLWVI